MPPRYVVLGCGLVGSLMAKELARSTVGSAEVVSVDLAQASLDRLPKDLPNLSTRLADFRDRTSICSAIAPADVVLTAVPGFLGFDVVRTVIEAGKDVVDISFMPEDQRTLSVLAKSKNVTAVVDAGVSPGMSNLFAALGEKELSPMKKGVIFVGGLPQKRLWPYEYRIVFSACDVLEEYTRPARFRLGGEVVTRPALSDLHLIDFPRIGTVEAFNTDGLRTLLTSSVPDLKEMTLRWPGHVDRMRMLRETGFFDPQPVTLPGGVRVSPLALTSRLLGDAWKLRPGERELTFLRVDCEGVLDGRPTRIEYELYDETDPTTGDTSMSRTTGLPAVAIAQQIMASKVGGGAPILGGQKGVFPLDELPQDEALVKRIWDFLVAHGVSVERRVVPL